MRIAPPICITMLISRSLTISRHLLHTDLFGEH